MRFFPFVFVIVSVSVFGYFFNLECSSTLLVVPWLTSTKRKRLRTITRQKKRRMMKEASQMKKVGVKSMKMVSNGFFRKFGR